MILIKLQCCVAEIACFYDSFEWHCTENEPQEYKQTKWRRQLAQTQSGLVYTRSGLSRFDRVARIRH